MTGRRQPPPVIVSACLVGVRCNHKGAASPSASVQGLAATRQLIPICPEVAGGLAIPRPAAERRRTDGRVVTGEGSDVTSAYERGAARAVSVAVAAGATDAVLKARSPSCGCHQIYDGTFSRRLVEGEGVTAAALRVAGVRVRSEEDIEAGG